MTSPGDQAPSGSEAPLPGEELGRIARARASAEEAKARGAEILAREQSRRPAVRMAVEAWNKDRRFAGGLLAGGLAFKTFLWLLPFAVVVVALVGGLADQLDEAPSDLARESGLSAALAATVAQAVEASNQGRLYLLLIGIPLLLWAGMGLVRASRLVSALAWGVSPKAGGNQLVASAVLAVSAVGILAVNRVMLRLLGGPLATDLFVILGEFALITTVVTYTYSALPHDPDVDWLRMVPGAMLMAVGVLVCRVVTMVYFAGRLDRVDDLYGALGVASVFLAWLFILCRLWVAGVTLNSSGRMSFRVEGNG